MEEAHVLRERLSRETNELIKILFPDDLNRNKIQIVIFNIYQIFFKIPKFYSKTVDYELSEYFLKEILNGSMQIL